MQHPDIPKNEKERLEALRVYDLLNKKRHPEFDEIVALAAYICDFSNQNYHTITLFC